MILLGSCILDGSKHTLSCKHLISLLLISLSLHGANASACVLKHLGTANRRSRGISRASMCRDCILEKRGYMLKAAIEALYRCGVTGTLRKRIAMLIQEEALLCVVGRFPLPREAHGSIGLYVAASDIDQLYTDVGHAVAACSLVEEAEVFNEEGMCNLRDAMLCVYTANYKDDPELEYIYNSMARRFMKALWWIRSHAHRYVRTAHEVGLHIRATKVESLWETVPKAFHTWGNVHGKPCKCGYSPLFRERLWELARAGQSKSFNVPNMRKSLMAKCEGQKYLWEEDMRDLCNSLPRYFAHTISSPETWMPTSNYLSVIRKYLASLYASRVFSCAFRTQKHMLLLYRLP